MKNTKEVTTGAMLLAIYGALLLIDRQFSFFLIEIIALASPILIIIFGNLYNFKDGLFFSVAILIIALILSPNPYSYFYIPFGIIIGNAYNFMINKGLRSKVILVITMALYAIADLCYTFTISPLFMGISFTDLVNESNELINLLLSYIPVDLNISNIKFATTLTYASIILTSVMEGFLTHIITILLFKRFKINRISFNQRSILELKPIPAYILMFGSALNLIAFRISDDNITSILFVVGSICSYILIYYGYIYVLMYSRIKTGKNMGLFIILGILFLLPASFLILLIIGFLYGTGPLKKYLVLRKDGNNEKS